MKRLWAVTGFLAVMITSCPLNGENKPGTEPVYNSRVVWKAEIVRRGSRANMLYTDGYAYVQESSFLTANYGYEGMFIGFDIDHQPGVSHLIAIRVD